MINKKTQSGLINYTLVMKSLRNNPNRAIGFMRSVWEAFGKCLGAFLVVVMMERAQLESGRDPAKVDGLKCVG